MKANEAPKKIYIQAFNINKEDSKFERLLYFDDVWTEEPESGQENIEYIRTDAFIEKACEFLSKSSNYNEGFIYPSHSGVIDAFVNNFKNYMKGE